MGANGYIGRHLAFFLNQRGFDVFAYDIQLERNPNIPKNISYEMFDICDNYEHIKLNVDYVFVFSGITGTKIGFENYRTLIEVNEIGLLNILNKIKLMKYKPKVIFPSSRLVYSGAECALSESANKDARTIYAVNKLSCEYYLAMYARCFDIKYTVYRICVPYGNLFDDDFSYGTIGFFLNKAKRGEPITLYGDGQLKRTFTHVVSICEQIASTMGVIETTNCIYNIAGETFSLKDIAQKIAAKYNTNVVYIPWKEIDLKIESGSTFFDSKAISSLCKECSNYQFEEWLNQIKLLH